MSRLERTKRVRGRSRYYVHDPELHDLPKAHSYVLTVLKGRNPSPPVRRAIQLHKGFTVFSGTGKPLNPKR